MLHAALALATRGAVAGDRVGQLPGFDAPPFAMYSGYLDVPGPVGGHASLRIHYELQESQRSPAGDPLVLWQQGGPGASSIAMGALTEVGWHQVAGDGPRGANPWAWNREASVLFLDHPAGVGFSQCLDSSGAPLPVCAWNDTSQAEALARTLDVFLAAYPELGRSGGLYLTGESYAGQFLPNAAAYLLSPTGTNHTGSALLRGLAVGNGCWGVQCNGPHETRNEVDFFHGHGLISDKLYAAIQAACDWSRPDDGGMPCALALASVTDAVGPHNIYDVYDNCRDSAGGPGAAERRRLGALDPGANGTEGGYDWPCGGYGAPWAYLARGDVQAALHLSAAHHTNSLGIAYDQSGPASVTLYPALLRALRVLIYSGDADTWVPHVGAEEWTSALPAGGAAVEADPWRPWYTDADGGGVPAGAVTTYVPPGSAARGGAAAAAAPGLSFATVRLAGHMVPSFRPAAAFSMMRRFLAGSPL